MKRRQALKSILVTKGLLLSGMTFSGSVLAGSGPSTPSGPSAPSVASAPSAPSSSSSSSSRSSSGPSRPSAPGASSPSGPGSSSSSSSRGSFPSSPSAASLPSTASRPSGPDDYLDGSRALSPEEQQALLDRIQAQLQTDGLQAVSESNLDALLAEFL